MKVLALDSSGLVASVALVEGTLEASSLLAEYTINYKKTHSQTLLPMLDEIVRMTELELETVDAIAVAAGPGSFTGLRIGSATAKGLGLALDKPLVAVPTLEALAYNLYGTDKLICPLMDARRNQVYTGVYEYAGECLKVLHPPMAADIAKVADLLCELGRDVIFLGDGVPVYKEYLHELMADGKRNAGIQVLWTPAHLNKQRAGAVGARALWYLQEGKTQTAAEHTPEYLRLSQAERERAEQEKRS